MIAAPRSPVSLALAVRGIHAMGNPRDFHRNPRQPLQELLHMCEKHNLLLAAGVPSRPAYQNTPTLPKTEHANPICAAISGNCADAGRRRDGSLLARLATAGGGGGRPGACWSHDNRGEIEKGLRKTCRSLDFGRKPEFPEKNPRRRARKMQSRHKATTNPETSSDAKRPISRQ